MANSFPRASNETDVRAIMSEIIESSAQKKQTGQTVTPIVSDEPGTASEWVEQLVEGLGASFESYNVLLNLAMATSREDVMAERIEELARRRLVDIKGKGIDGTTLMHFATTGGHVGAMKWLSQKHNLDVNVRLNNGMMPIHIAAMFGRLEAVRWLLDNGPTGVDAAGPLGKTPMHLAALSGKVDVMEELKNRGSQVDIKIENGKPVMDFSEANELMRALL